MRKTTFIFVIAATLCNGQAWAGKKVVCWNDDQGHKMCGDTVPPRYVKKEQQIMNDRGVVVETRAHEKTPEELAAAAKMAEEAKQAQEQAKYDNYLVQSYQKVSDLESMRKERVTTLEGRVALAEKSVTDMQATVKTLHDRVEGLKKKQKEPDKNLAKQIKTYDKALLENIASVEALKQEREKTVAKFDKDIARFKELRPEAAPAPAAKP